MFLNQVEAFVNVADYKSFSRTAKELFVSQPTVSAHIKALEQELNTQLLVRTTKDVVLTDAGRLFYDYALEMIRIRDVAQKELQNFTKEFRGKIEIAAATISAQYMLPDILPDFIKKYPDIFFSIRQMDSQSVIDNIENFRYELGLTGMIIPDSKCVFEPLLQDRLVLAAPNTARYRQLFENEFPIQLLRKEPFIIREEGSGTQRAAFSFLESLELSRSDLHIVAELPSPECIKQAVRNKIGLAIVSKRSIQDYLDFNYCISYDFNSVLLNRNLYLVHHKNRVFSPTVNFFVSYLKNKLGK